MHLHRERSEPIDIAPEEGFTGRVVVRGYFRRHEPSRLAGAIVTYPPRARSPWKVNPAGQTVVVTSGSGWAQSSGEDVVELRAGDIAWFPPGERHWEGATPTLSMTSVALHESAVEFLDRVTDEQYLAGSPGIARPLDATVRCTHPPGDDVVAIAQQTPEGDRS